MRYITDEQIEGIKTFCCGAKYIKLHGWSCGNCHDNLTSDLMAVDNYFGNVMPLKNKFDRCVDCNRLYEKANSPRCPVCRFNIMNVKQLLAGRAAYLVRLGKKLSKKMEDKLWEPKNK